jgi:hypothetical protein
VIAQETLQLRQGLRLAQFCFCRFVNQLGEAVISTIGFFRAQIDFRGTAEDMQALGQGDQSNFILAIISRPSALAIGTNYRKGLIFFPMSLHKPLRGSGLFNSQ